MVEMVEMIINSKFSFKLFNAVTTYDKILT